MDVDRVLLASPRGFCAGVEMAIKALAWMVRAFEPPVYCYHEIVHNKLVVERFRSLGVVFVDDIDDVPPGRPIMLSAHGSAPEVVASSRRWVVVVLLVAIVVAFALFAQPRLRLYDRYRPGTTHRASTQLNGCDRPGGLTIDGDPASYWDSHDRLPANWPQVPISGAGTAIVVGTLEITDVDRATFTADQGGSVEFARLRPMQFDDLSCPIK